MTRIRRTRALAAFGGACLMAFAAGCTEKPEDVDVPEAAEQQAMQEQAAPPSSATTAPPAELGTNEPAMPGTESMTEIN